MKISEIMTQEVMSVAPQTPIREAAEIMLKNHISGLPVIDERDVLVGIVTEGDFLRRAELGTEKRRPKWLEFVVNPAKLAGEYVHSHSRTVANVMTTQVYTVGEETSLQEAVDVMERRQVKRLPVTRAGRVVGIVTRANLLRALVALPLPSTKALDAAVRDMIYRELGKYTWGPRQINVVVRNGVVDIWGLIFDDSERRAVCTVAENAPGVTDVRDHLTWIEPYSGAVVDAGILTSVPEPDWAQYS